MSGWTVQHSASASSPLPASSTWWPRRVSTLWRNFRMYGSSSTIKMVATVVAPVVLKVYQFFPDAILGQFRIIPHVHLLQDPGSVRTNCLHAQVDLFGDFAHCLARANTQHYIVFPIRQTLVERPGKIAVQIGGERFPQTRTDKSPAAQHLADGGQQDLGRTSFVKVTGCACPQYAGGKLLLWVRAQDQDGKPGMGAPDILQDIEPSPSRQREIQYDQIPRPVANRLQGFRSIAR